MNYIKSVFILFLGIETVSEYSNPTSPVYIHKQMQALEQSRQNYFPSIYEAPAPITDSQVYIIRIKIKLFFYGHLMNSIACEI